jgi:hypothetical protein
MPQERLMMMGGCFERRHELSDFSNEEKCVDCKRAAEVLVADGIRQVSWGETVQHRGLKYKEDHVGESGL